MPPRPLTAFILLSALLLCSCESTTIARGKLSQLVLTEQDLGPGYSAFSNGQQSRLDNQGTARADPTRYGRQGGWIARFRQTDATVSRGILVVESRADLFKDTDGARADLAAYRRTFSQAPAGDVKQEAVEGLGDEAAGSTFTQPGTRAIRFYRVAWRFRNATASVTIQGFDGEVSLTDAVNLARKQQKRLAAA